MASLDGIRCSVRVTSNGGSRAINLSRWSQRWECGVSTKRFAGSGELSRRIMRANGRSKEDGGTHSGLLHRIVRLFGHNPVLSLHAESSLSWEYLHRLGHS